MNTLEQLSRKTHVVSNILDIVITNSVSSTGGVASEEVQVETFVAILEYISVRASVVNRL